jgi:hypothetical protein
MTGSQYLNKPVSKRELRDLSFLANEEESAFFERNKHLIKPYRSRLVLAALCQGAALHYIGQGYGIKDFDIHYFYRQNPKKPKLSRTVYNITANVGGFSAASVDFIRTVIPHRVCQKINQGRIGLIRCFLSLAPTDNAKKLSQKAVVAIWPDDIFGAIIWP